MKTYSNSKTAVKIILVLSRPDRTIDHRRDDDSDSEPNIAMNLSSAYKLASQQLLSRQKNLLQLWTGRNSTLFIFTTPTSTTSYTYLQDCQEITAQKKRSCILAYKRQIEWDPICNSHSHITIKVQQVSVYWEGDEKLNPRALRMNILTWAEFQSKCDV